MNLAMGLFAESEEGAVALVRALFALPALAPLTPAGPGFFGPTITTEPVPPRANVQGGWKVKVDCAAVAQEWSEPARVARLGADGDVNWWPQLRTHPVTMVVMVWKKEG